MVNAGFHGRPLRHPPRGAWAMTSPRPPMPRRSSPPWRAPPRRPAAPAASGSPRLVDRAQRPPTATAGAVTGRRPDEEILRLCRRGQRVPRAPARSSSPPPRSTRPTATDGGHVAAAERPLNWNVLVVVRRKNMEVPGGCQLSASDVAARRGGQGGRAHPARPGPQPLHLRVGLRASTSSRASRPTSRPIDERLRTSPTRTAARRWRAGGVGHRQTGPRHRPLGHLHASRRWIR